MAGTPSDSTDRVGTQNRANCLAAVGLAALTIAPEMRAARGDPRVIGGLSGAVGLSFAFPIWRDATTLSAVHALRSQSDLRKQERLKYLVIHHVLVEKRISFGKFMNFSRARSTL